MAMDAMLATIANGRQEIYHIDREAGRNKLIHCLIYHFKINPLMAALANTFCRGTWGWGMFCHKTNASNCWKSSLNPPDCCCSSLVITPGTSPCTMGTLDRIVIPKIKTKIVLTVGDYFKRVSYLSNFSNAVWSLAIP
jgi:hypothetical protein